jgi:hypothetical protein
VNGVELGFEFSLLVQCCRWNFASAEAQSRPDVAPSMDWNLVVALARRHRVQGLVWNALAQRADQLPEHVRNALSAEARAIAATNLGIAAECCALQQLFDQSKVAQLFIKGLSVGALAYRSPMLKMGWDIDLLIDPSDLSAAASLLSERGYVPRLPSRVADLEAWHGQSKESVWHRNESFYVELHTRLADNQRLIPWIDVQSPRQIVEVAPGARLPTLAEEELFAYLAVHGASSAWFRLKWISDFAALLDGRSGGEIGRLYRRSQELGAGRAAGQALLLADMLFNSLDPIPELRRQLTASGVTRLLGRAALRMMVSGCEEPTERPLGTLTIHWTQFLLQPGIGFKVSELSRQAQSIRRMG